MIYPRQLVYSLKALGFMATQPAGKSMKVKELASQLDIPKHYLGKILTELVKKRFVNSTKGPSGGFVLAVNPNNVSVYRVMAELGALGKLEDSCVMGLAECSPEVPCALHEIWIEFKDSAVSRSQKLSLKEYSETLVKKLGMSDGNNAHRPGIVEVN